MVRKKQQPYREKVSGELDVLPMMNLFVVLIPMLLLSAVFLEMAVIRMNLPSDESAPPGAKETLGLSLSIEDARYVIQGRDLARRTIERSGAEGEAELRSALASVATSFPDNHEIVIVSESHTRYDDIIQVMDISRETGLGNISLSGDGGAR